MIAMSPSVLQNPKKQSVSKNITLNIIEFALRTCARARAISYSCNMKSQVESGVHGYGYRFTAMLFSDSIS